MKGKIHGTEILYHDEGSKRSENSYQSGKPWQQIVIHYPDGMKLQETPCERRTAWHGDSVLRGRIKTERRPVYNGNYMAR